MDVEALIDKFAVEVGDELVSRLLPKSPPQVNADYIFRNSHAAPVIVELKRLTGDPRPHGLQEKFSELCESWINRRIMSPFWGRKTIDSQELPWDAQGELFDRLGRRIKKAIHDASGQIRTTKKYFNLTNGRGLLLLVQDGDYSLQPDLVMHLVNRSMTGSGSAIDTLIYFTVNMVSSMPGTDRNALIWIEAHHVARPPVSPEFLKWFRESWMEFFSKEVGAPIPVIPCDDRVTLSQMRFLQPPEPGKYYVDKLGRNFRCMAVEGDSVKWLRFDYRSGEHVLHVVFGQNLRHAHFYEPISDQLEIKRLKTTFKSMQLSKN